MSRPVLALPPGPLVGRPRACAWRRRLLWPTTAAALLHTADATGASYLPGPLEPDPPTGDVTRGVGDAAMPSTAAVDVAGGSGIRWTLGPIQHAGTLSLDARALRLSDGSTSRQGLLFNDIDLASYVWQPWFVQLRAGLGLLAARQNTHDADAGSTSGHTRAVTGRFQVDVFPASRFPFELRAEVGDSRTRGDTLGSDYRSHRFSLSQAYRPETGNDNVSVSFDRSRLTSGSSGSDTLTALQATAMRQWASQSIELGASWSLNERDDDGARSRLASFSARHAWHAIESLDIDTLATWSDVRLRGLPGGTLDIGTDTRQLSSFATWRPRDGEWLYSANSPLYLTGSARIVDAGSDFGGTEQRVHALTATLGMSQDLTRAWRLSAAVTASQVDDTESGSTRSASANAAAAYAGEALPLGDWRYTPNGGASIGATRGGIVGRRTTLGLQASHGLARDWPLAEGVSVSVNLTQSAAVLRESPQGQTSPALAHSASLFWQSAGDGGSQGYAGLSASDSRTWSDDSGRFQIVNLQLSRRLQTSRHTSWSGNLTLQASRSDALLIDPFDGLPRLRSAGWQRFYSGALTYENQRVFSVQRLRYTLLITADSQQIERRSAGDIDAPPDRIDESIEHRLDYSIGRLDARLSARVARIEGRTVASVLARVQRRY